MLSKRRPFSFGHVFLSALGWAASNCGAISLGLLLEFPSSNLNLL